MSIAQAVQASSSRESGVSISLATNGYPGSLSRSKNNPAVDVLQKYPLQVSRAV